MTGGSAIQKAGTAAVKKATQTALKEARAVTAKEAPTIAPATESSKESSMPWKGWFAKTLVTQFGEERVDGWRRILYYKPDDIHDFNQIPNPSTKVPITKDKSQTAMFRYPSPGSQDPVRIPKGFEPDEDPYDTSYYKRDTARRFRDSDFSQQEKTKLELMNSNNPDVQKLREELSAGPESSPGNQGRFATGPSDFDPTGLRATMSATNAALEASLDANMPDHVCKISLFIIYLSFIKCVLTPFCIYKYSSPNRNGLTVRMKLSNGIRLVVCQCPLEELDLEPCRLIGVLQSGNWNERKRSSFKMVVVVIHPNAQLLLRIVTCTFKNKLLLVEKWPTCKTAELLR